MGLDIHDERSQNRSIDLDGLRGGFLYQAARLPRNPAFSVGDRICNYAQAEDIARRWATPLIEVTGGCPRRIGIFANRSETAYLGILATLFAGSGFIPLNRNLPLERTRDMLRLSEADALIVDNESLPQLGTLLDGIPQPRAILIPETDDWTRPNWVSGRVFQKGFLAKVTPAAALPPIAGDDLAYLLFTSGSTGSPKGVPITHSNIRAFLDFNTARYRLTSDDRLTQTFDQTFDLSVFDLFMAWENGACVCSMQPIELLSPYHFLKERQITVWFSVPSVAALLMKRGTLVPGSLPTLRWSLFCGEGLPRLTAEAWQAAAPHSIVENLYGPTELTIACAAYRWDPTSSVGDCIDELVPIGEPYSGLSHAVVDNALRDVRPGEAGELCVAGPQVFPGYWGAAELSQGSFFKRRAADGTTARFFRTGDIVVRRTSHYAYLGRCDQQIKIAGYRVDALEVEAALRRAGCIDAVALPWPDERRPECIVAVVSGVENTAELSSRVRQWLPSYMVPRDIFTTAQMPLNGNGKVDRNVLRQWLAAQPSPVNVLLIDESERAQKVYSSVAPRASSAARTAIEPLIARALGIGIEQVHDQLSYQSIPEWDSIRQVGLIIALETALGTGIGDDVASKLCSVAAIRAFASTFDTVTDQLSGPLAGSSEPPKDDQTIVHRGLEGICVDRSTITHIDGENGKLEYRGYNLDDLIEGSSFEETAWLLLHGDLPDATALEAFRQELEEYRYLTPAVSGLMGILAHTHPMEALRTGVSALGALASPSRVDAEDKTIGAGVHLIAQIPALIVTHHAVRTGRELAASRAMGSHAATVLEGVLGFEASPEAVRIVDQILIAHADHGSNASAFAARVAIGTQADIYAAITAAIATFAGNLHGGAAERVLELIDTIGTPEGAEAYVKHCLDMNRPVMGFGHRVYHCEDPRVRYLREAAHRLSRERGNNRFVSVVEALVAAMEPYARHGVHPNVDLYAGVIYRLLGIPDDLVGAMFIAGRIAGWVAQAIEQRTNNVLIRPLLRYVGITKREYQPIAARMPTVKNPGEHGLSMS